MPLTLFKRLKSKKKLIAIITASVILLLIVIGVIYYLWAESGGNTGKKVNLMVYNGETIDGLSSELSNLKIIRSQFAFLIYLHLHQPPTLIAGDYQMREDLSFSALYSILKHGPTDFSLIIPPGLTVAQIADRVGQIPGMSSFKFLQVAQEGQITSPYEPVSVRGTPNGLEGLLGAATYEVSPNESYVILLNQMIQNFNLQAKSLGLNPSGVYTDNLTAYQVIVVASIVREEAGLNSDRPKVARVILNRLNDSMLLQMDSTVRYAIGDPPRAPNLNDLKINSPYNTYLFKGLPPTPISTVDSYDINAVLSPATGSWLYFVVVSPNGQEAFATTYQQQLQNEQLATSRGLNG